MPWNTSAAAVTTSYILSLTPYSPQYDIPLGLLYIALGCSAMATNGKLFLDLYSQWSKIKSHTYFLLVGMLCLTDFLVGFCTAIPLGKIIKSLAVLRSTTSFRIVHITFTITYYLFRKSITSKLFI